MKSVERAVFTFDEGFSCSQALLSAFGPELGLDREMALRVATAFGGGMGHRGDTCGAVTGAFMAMGLKHGRLEADDEETRDRVYSLVDEFVRRFEERHGSIVCRELLGCDISTAEGMKFVKDNNISSTRCPNYVRDAAQILGELLS